MQMFVPVAFSVFFSPGLKKILTLAIKKNFKSGTEATASSIQYFASVSFLLSKTLQLL